MTKQLLSTLVAFMLVSFCFAQQIILDHESPATTTNYTYFGSFVTPGPPSNSVIANPYPGGINTSATVGDFIKPAFAEVWAGAFPNPALSAPVNTVTNSQICIDVYMEEFGNLGLKLEQSFDGGPNWIITKANTKINEWEQLCFDLTTPSLEPPFIGATGYNYNAVVLFFDFGISPPTTRNYYFDNLVATNAATPAAIPTMSQWSLFYLALIMLIFGIVYVSHMQTSVQLAGAGQVAPKFTLKQFPFDWNGFTRAFYITLAIVPLGFALIYFVWGEIIFDDLLGMTLAIPLVSYLIYLIKK